MYRVEMTVNPVERWRGDDGIEADPQESGTLGSGLTGPVGEGIEGLHDENNRSVVVPSPGTDPCH